MSRNIKENMDKIKPLRGIRIFGFGSIIPMNLITSTISNSSFRQIGVMEQESGKEIQQYQLDEIEEMNVEYENNGINTPINNFPTDDVQCIEMNDLEETNNDNNNYDVGSPTCINFDDDIMRASDKEKEPKSLQECQINKCINNNTGVNETGGGGGGLISNELIGEIILKAEFGRVIMGIDDI